MGKEELKIKISEILGLSASEKDLAFEMMLKRLSKMLKHGEAISVPNIGVFSLKTEPLLREERSEKLGSVSNKNLIFLPEENKSNPASNSMYLTFNLENPNEDYIDFDENVFSTSIGKPIITINGIQDELNGENSERMVATLEEKVQNLVANTERITNYDIWKEITPEGHGAGKDEDNPNIISDDDELKQLVSENVENDDESEDEIFDEENGVENEEILNDEEISNDEEIFDDDLGHDDGIQEFEPSEPIESIEQEEDSDEILLDDNIEAESEQKVDEPEGGETDDKAEKEEDIDWDWGDELKEELESDTENVDENQNIPIEEQEEKSTEKVNDGSELFDRLESDEVEENEADDTVEDVAESEEEVKEETKTEGKDISKTIEYSPDDDFGEDEKSQNKIGQLLEKIKLGKTLWMLIGAFVLIGIVGVYFLFFSGSEEVSEKQANVVPDTLIQKKLKPIENISNVNSNVIEHSKLTPKPAETEAGIEKAKKNSELKTDKSEEKKPEVKSQTKGIPSDLYRVFPDEKQVKNLIFFQNGVYSVQVSSRKNKTKAEQYAKRLRNAGYDAFIVKTYLSKLKSTWYRVRIGYFNSIEEASEFRKKNKF